MGHRNLKYSGRHKGHQFGGPALNEPSRRWNKSGPLGSPPPITAWKSHKLFAGIQAMASDVVSI